MNTRTIKFIITLFVILFSFSTISAQSASIKKMREQAGTLRKEITEKEKILLSSQKDVKSRLNNLDIINAQIKEVKKCYIIYLKLNSILYFLLGFNINRKANLIITYYYFRFIYYYTC